MGLAAWVGCLSRVRDRVGLGCGCVNWAGLFLSFVGFLRLPFLRLVLAEF